MARSTMIRSPAAKGLVANAPNPTASEIYRTSHESPSSPLSAQKVWCH